MQDNDKAPASVCETQVEAIAEKSGALISCGYDTTQGRGLQAPIADLLPRGEKNAIPTRELMSLSGYASARQLQKQIEAERAAGALILSASTGGYFRPSAGEVGRAEICRYEATLRRRAISTFRTLKTARRALRELDGQVQIGVDDDG
jgi:hypothetical protein